jgi:Fe2+ or Zn2+ uptake regulation protein
LDVTDQILDQVRDRGGRVTPVTRRIVEVLVAEPDSHRSSVEIVQLLQAQEPTIESTVYRVLDRLVSFGVLEQLVLGSGPPAFHLRPHHHEHVVCERCGKVIDVPDDLLDGVAKALRRDHGFVLKLGTAALHGTCADCATS